MPTATRARPHSRKSGLHNPPPPAPPTALGLQAPLESLVRTTNVAGTTEQRSTKLRKAHRHIQTNRNYRRHSRHHSPSVKATSHMCPSTSECRYTPPDSKPKLARRSGPADALQKPNGTSGSPGINERQVVHPETNTCPVFPSPGYYTTRTRSRAL